MFKLLILITILTSLSVSADPYSYFEAKRCKRQFKKTLKKENLVFSKVRYEGTLHTYPLINEFSVHQKGISAPLEVMQMVKLPGKKCARY